MKARLIDRLGISVPIVQGAFGGYATQHLAATISNGGGLGALGAHGLVPQAIGEAIAEIRSLTSKPFAINLWVSMQDEGTPFSDEAAFERSLQPFLEPLAELGTPQPTYKPFQAIRFEDQARAVIDAKVPVFTFIYGVPPAEILEECRKQGIVTIGGATTVDEARALRDAGVDAVVASGFEAGGHRGSFLRPAEESLMGTFSLVPQIADAIEIPVIAAGGVSDARGVAAAFALGADGVQVGTAFLACKGSDASDAHRAMILSGRSQTALTKGLTGRLARGIRNPLMDRLNAPGVEVLPYPLQRLLLRNVTAPAEVAGRADLLALWSGMSANLTQYDDAAELLTNLAAAVPDYAKISSP